MTQNEYQQGYAAGFIECFNQMRESTQPMTVAWAARNRNGELHLFQTEPEKLDDDQNGIWAIDWNDEDLKVMRIYDFGSLNNVQWTDQKATLVQIKAVKQ